MKTRRSNYLTTDAFDPVMEKRLDKLNKRRKPGNKITKQLFGLAGNMYLAAQDTSFAMGMVEMAERHLKMCGDVKE